MAEFGRIVACQACGSGDLLSALFLSYLPPVNTMHLIGTPASAEEWYPAELLQCTRCHLVQLGYAVDPRVLFPPEYPYTSGSTRVLRENFAGLAEEVHALVGLSPHDLVVDVGSNDGTLLANFKDRGCRVVGVEPTLTGDLARERGITTLTAFFSSASAAQVVSENGQARLVTATNVFAHIHGVAEVMEAVRRLLAPGGVFITESHYFAELTRTLQYDTIYHEHLRYYTLTSLRNLLEQHGFHVFHVTRIPTHGGSIRVYASEYKSMSIHPSVPTLLQEEQDAGLAGTDWIDGFTRRVRNSKLDLNRLLGEVKRAGDSVYGVGAPSRASTLITYAGLDEGTIDCVLEVPSSRKVGKYMPGTRIPVVDEARLYVDQPRYALLLSWHIAPELIANLTKRGFTGDFIVPLPEPRILAAQ